MILSANSASQYVQAAQGIGLAAKTVANKLSSVGKSGLISAAILKNNSVTALKINQASLACAAGKFKILAGHAADVAKRYTKIALITIAASTGVLLGIGGLVGGGMAIAAAGPVLTALLWGASIGLIATSIASGRKHINEQIDLLGNEQDNFANEKVSTLKKLEDSRIEAEASLNEARDVKNAELSAKRGAHATR